MVDIVLVRHLHLKLVTIDTAVIAVIETTVIIAQTPMHTHAYVR